MLLACTFRLPRVLNLILLLCLRGGASHLHPTAKKDLELLKTSLRIPRCVFGSEKLSTSTGRMGEKSLPFFLSPSRRGQHQRQRQTAREALANLSPVSQPRLYSISDFLCALNGGFSLVIDRALNLLHFSNILFSLFFLFIRLSRFVLY